MNRRGFLVAFAGLFALGAGSAQGSAPGDMPAGPATLMVGEHGALGQHLTDAEGRTLYLFLNDRDGESGCLGECATAWPPLLTEGAPVAGEGVEASLLGTHTREDGSVQVVYNTYPLYYFAEDEAPGDILGQDTGDIWYVISPQGLRVSTEVEGDEPSDP